MGAGCTSFSEIEASFVFKNGVLHLCLFSEIAAVLLSIRTLVNL